MIIEVLLFVVLLGALLYRLLMSFVEEKISFKQIEGGSQKVLTNGSDLGSIMRSRLSPTEPTIFSTVTH